MADAASVSRTIAPVTPDQRRLSGLDLAVLRGDLGVGLLVLVAGALLVPGLSLGEAMLAIAIGSVLGSFLLGIPTMVLARAALGLRGSYLPTTLNVLQLLGWATFEIFVMAQVAAAVTQRALGLELYVFWAVLFAVICRRRPAEAVVHRGHW